MSEQSSGAIARMTVSEVAVDLCRPESVLTAAAARGGIRRGRPLVIGSVNLDHLHHFGRGRPHQDRPQLGAALDWLMLADGMPIALRARLLTGGSWPRITGADLLPRLLEQAIEDQRAVGFLGGQPDVHDKLRQVVGLNYPNLRVAGLWSPDRGVLTDIRRSKELADEIRDADTEILVVGLGKPLQELWIAQHGADTGAQVLLAFGASADFLAGAAQRAPRWMQRFGLEWAYRLGREPRRMARRYLLQGPGALARLRCAALDFPSPLLRP